VLCCVRKTLCVKNILDVCVAFVCGGGGGSCGCEKGMS